MIEKTTQNIVCFLNRLSAGFFGMAHGILLGTAVLCFGGLFGGLSFFWALEKWEKIERWRSRRKEERESKTWRRRGLAPCRVFVFLLR